MDERPEHLSSPPVRSLRRFDRIQTGVKAGLKVCRGDWSVYDKGTATIRDISPSGARVVDVGMRLGGLPRPPFWVALRPPGGRWIRGRIVRIEGAGNHGFGIQFMSEDTTLPAKFSSPG